MFERDPVRKVKIAHNFFGWISYTLSRSERKDASATDYRLFDGDQTHILRRAADTGAGGGHALTHPLKVLGDDV